MTLNVFVYHGTDRQGRLLSEIVRLCDHERKFEFLPIETSRSMEHLDAFLAKQHIQQCPFEVTFHWTLGSSPNAVQLPFVVFVDRKSGQQSESGEQHNLGPDELRSFIICTRFRLDDLGNEATWTACAFYVSIIHQGLTQSHSHDSCFEVYSREIIFKSGWSAWWTWHSLNTRIGVPCTHQLL